jgi:hypothetical protein
VRLNFFCGASRGITANALLSAFKEVLMGVGASFPLAIALLPIRTYLFALRAIRAKSRLQVCQHLRLMLAEPISVTLREIG